MKTAIKRVIPLFVSLVVLCVTFAVPVSADTSIDYLCDGTVDVSLTRDEFYNVIQHCFDSVTSWNTDQSSLVSISQEAGVLMSSGTAYPHFAQAGIYTYQKNSSLVYFRLLFADDTDLTLARNGSTYRFYLSGANFCCVNLYYNVLNDSFTYISYSVASNAPNYLEACNQNADILDLTTYYFYYSSNYESTTDVMWAIIPDYTSLASMGIESESFGIAYPDYIPEESENENTENTGQEQLEVSNNILTNIKNILQYIADLPSNIFNAFSERITAIINAIQTLPQLIADNIESILSALFIPQVGFSEHFTTIENALRENMPFIATLIDTFTDVSDRLQAAGSEAPVFSISYDDTEIVFIDFSMFNDYISEIRAIMLTVIWIVFIWHTAKRIPAIIHGLPDTQTINASGVKEAIK